MQSNSHQLFCHTQICTLCHLNNHTYQCVQQRASIRGLMHPFTHLLIKLCMELQLLKIISMCVARIFRWFCGSSEKPIHMSTSISCKYCPHESRNVNAHEKHHILRFVFICLCIVPLMVKPVSFISITVQTIWYTVVSSISIHCPFILNKQSSLNKLTHNLTTLSLFVCTQFWGRDYGVLCLVL